ncbi:META domain-containing protein [uncultured Bosea sp.]|uniref:META domain-containing protein n=1 Tax=uncultured Bosea sp. TaxID=211457 RepID=UPI00263AC07C|nr:META domain-containing protein [uncultured Bosea sp.]
MIRRLGLAAVLASLAVPMLASSEAVAQRRGGKEGQPTREQYQAMGTPISQQEKTFPLGASWSVVALNGKPVQDRRATLMVDMNLRGTGFGGCNTFSAAAYPLRQQGFAVGPIALTKRSCDKGMLEFEKAFLLALRATSKWDLVSGRLVLKGGAGEVTLSRSL